MCTLFSSFLNYKFRFICVAYFLKNSTNEALFTVTQYRNIFNLSLESNPLSSFFAKLYACNLTNENSSS